MKKTIVGVLAILTCFVVLGTLVGCHSKKTGKKQDGVPVVVTDNIPEEPAKEENEDTAAQQQQTQQQTQQSDSTSFQEALQE